MHVVACGDWGPVAVTTNKLTHRRTWRRRCQLTYGRLDTHAADVAVNRFHFAVHGRSVPHWYWCTSPVTAVPTRPC
eukprot:5400233-Prymnesium_polylepis.1